MGPSPLHRCHEWSKRHGMRHRVVERDPTQTGFVVLAGRWVVERSFGWLVHWGGLLRDRAGRLDVSAARLAFAASLSGVEALLNPMPVQDAAKVSHSNRLSVRVGMIYGPDLDDTGVLAQQLTAPPEFAHSISGLFRDLIRERETDPLFAG